MHVPVVYIGQSDSIVERHHRLLPFLLPYENARANALRSSESSVDFVASRLLVRVAIGFVLKIPATEVVLSQQCEKCGGGEHGAIRHPSHTRGWGAATAAWDPIGVDIESMDRQRLMIPPFDCVGLCPEEILSRLVANKGSSGSTMLWTVKEALLKSSKAITLADFPSICVLLSKGNGGDECLDGDTYGRRVGCWKINSHYLGIACESTAVEIVHHTDSISMEVPGTISLIDSREVLHESLGP